MLQNSIQAQRTNGDLVFDKINQILTKMNNLYVGCNLLVKRYGRPLQYFEQQENTEVNNDKVLMQVKRLVTHSGKFDYVSKVI